MRTPEDPSTRRPQNRSPRAPRLSPDRTVAGRLAAVVGDVLGDLPVRIRAWDGSEAGPAGAPVVVLRSRTALRRLLWNPDELGLARAYVAGEIDLDGDLADGLSRVWALIRSAATGTPGLARPPAAGPGPALRLGHPGPAARGRPREEAVLAGEKHSTGRDSDAISYHYDQSNDLYAALLDEHMAYSCAYFRADPRRPGAGTAATGSPRRSATSWSSSAASSAWPRACGCWTSAAAGAR